MLYLVDSSAKNSLGHNLEYLERISSVAKIESVIVGNSQLKTSDKCNIRAAFAHGTWDFGRFGLLKKESLSQSYTTSKTLPPSRMLIVIERLLEIFCKYGSRFLRCLILRLAGLSRQSKSYEKDLEQALWDLDSEGKIVISTINARELVGLINWIKTSAPNDCLISIILRRPFVDLRSLLEVPLLCIDAIVYMAAIHELSNKAKFYADSPGLASRIEKFTGKSISSLASMGFEPEQNRTRKTKTFALAPNWRSETRVGAWERTSISELSDFKKTSLDSKEYRNLLLTTKTLILPYDPLRYRSRSSGVFTEALTLGILPIVPTGTSMSREVSELNSGNKQNPIYTLHARANQKLLMTQLAGQSYIVEVTGNFHGSVILEVTKDKLNVKKSVHDFFEQGARDSFVINFTKETTFCFNSDRFFVNSDWIITLRIFEMTQELFGIAYLQGDLPNVLSLAKDVVFKNINETSIQTHTPSSICNSLGIPVETSK